MKCKTKHLTKQQPQYDYVNLTIDFLNTVILCAWHSIFVKYDMPNQKNAS